MLGCKFRKGLQLDDWWKSLSLNFNFIVYIQPWVTYCLVILVLTGSDVDEMVGCVVLKYVLWEIQGFDLFGLFVVVTVWWVCGCRSRCVAGTKNPLTSCGMLFRVSSIVINTCIVLFLSDTFSEGPQIPMYSPSSDFTMRLVASCPVDGFIDLTANTILGGIILSFAVRIGFWILSLTVSTILPISLSIFSIKFFSEVFTFTKFSLGAGRPPELPTVIS